MVDMAEFHFLARSEADALTAASVEDVERTAYLMAYEGLPVADREHNPFPKGDKRHVAFSEAARQGARDLEADAEVVRVIMEGTGGAGAPPGQEAGADNGRSKARSSEG